MSTQIKSTAMVVFAVGYTALAIHTQSPTALFIAGALSATAFIFVVISAKDHSS